MLRSIVLSIALAILSFADLTPAPARKATPDFSLEDSTGSLIKLSSYKGGVVLLATLLTTPRRDPLGLHRARTHQLEFPGLTDISRTRVRKA